METITATEFKAKCLALMDQVAATGRALRVTKHGKVVAQLVPASDKADYPTAEMRGSIVSLGDLVSPVAAPEDYDYDHGNL